VIIRVLEGSPVFGLVDSIVYVNSKPFLVCKRVSSVTYVPHYCAYRVVLCSSYFDRLFAVHELFTHHTHKSYSLEDQVYVVIKRCVGELY